MRKSLCRLVFACWLLLPASAFAEVIRQNPNALMSIEGTDTFSIRQDEVLAQLFAVRIVDPQGQPIAGLTVDFYPDYIFCFSSMPGCYIPPYGQFIDGTSLNAVLTDANGVARAIRFRAGTGPGAYAMLAQVLPSESARNAQVLQAGPSPAATFHIVQLGPVAVSTVPALGLTSALLLAAGVMLVALILLPGAGEASRRSPWLSRRAKRRSLQE